MDNFQEYSVLSGISWGKPIEGTFMSKQQLNSHTRKANAKIKL